MVGKCACAKVFTLFEMDGRKVFFNEGKNGMRRLLKYSIFVSGFFQEGSFCPIEHERSFCVVLLIFPISLRLLLWSFGFGNRVWPLCWHRMIKTVALCSEATHFLSWLLSDDLLLAPPYQILFLKQRPLHQCKLLCTIFPSLLIWDWGIGFLWISLTLFVDFFSFIGMNALF